MIIRDLPLDERKELAERMDVPLRMISQWARGEDPMSKRKAIQIEEKTNRKVMRYEAMFPEIDFNW